MSSPLSMAPRTPSSPAAKPTMKPHATPNSPQPRVSLFAKAAVPVLGAIDPAPAVLVRLDEQLDLRLLLVLVLLDPDSAKACRAACSPANRTSSMFSAAPVAAAAVPRRPGGRGLHRLCGAAVDLRGQVRRDRRDARGRGLEGGGGRQDPPRISPAHEGHDGRGIGRQPAADALELVLGEQVLEVVGVQAAADAAEHRPDRQAFQPSGEQAEEAPGQRRGQGARQGPPRVMDLRLVLGVDLDDHLIQDRVPALPDPLVQLPADLPGPLRSGKAGQQHALPLVAPRGRRLARGRRAFRSSALVFDPVVGIRQLVVFLTSVVTNWMIGPICRCVSG